MGTVPNIFGTQAGGDVLANLLDANFSALAGISGSPTTGHIAVWGTSNNITDGGALNVTAVMSAIAGLLPTSISGTNTTAAVTISAGQASDNTNAVYLGTSGNTSWSVTNGNAINGYAGGSTLPNSSTIHFFICSGVSGTGTFASTSLTPTFPSGYATYNRRIFALVTNSSGALIAMIPHEISGGGVDMAYTAALGALDFNSTLSDTARGAVTLTVPTGIIVKAVFNLNVSSTQDTVAVWVSDMATNDVAPATGFATPGGMAALTADAANFQTEQKTSQWTNTSGQIGLRSANNTTLAAIQTLGWIDPRRT